MKQSGNGYKLSKFVQKIFADLFVYGDARSESQEQAENGLLLALLLLIL